MKSPSTRGIIMLVISLIIVGMLLPIGLAYIAGSANTYIVVNGVNQTLAEWVDPTIISLLTIIVPIVAVVSIVIYYIPQK